MQGLFVYAIIRGGLRVLCDKCIGAIVGFNDIPVRTHTYLNKGGKIFYLLPPRNTYRSRHTVRYQGLILPFLTPQSA